MATGIKVTGQGGGATASSSSSSSPTFASLRAVDANHVYVWHCGAGCTTGNNLIADKGGVDLSYNRSSNPAGTQNVLAAQQYTMFQSRPALVSTSASTGVGARTQVNSTGLSLATNVSVTMEGFVQFPSRGLVGVSGSGYAVSCLSVGTGNDLMQVRYTNLDSGNIHFATSGANFGFPYGALPGYVSLDEPHHLMMVWDNSSTSIKCYLDGLLIYTFVSTSRSVTMTGAAITVLPFGGGISDFRISNIARSQAYAIDATRNMRQL